MSVEDNFGEYRRLILGELERLSDAMHACNAKIDALRADDISSMKVEIAMLKVKAGMVGALAGSLGGAVIAAIVGKLMGK